MEYINLYITDNIEALNEVADNQSANLKNVKKIEVLTNVASKLLGELNSNTKDHERTYIIGKRYLKVYDTMCKLRNDERFMAARYDSEVKKVQNIVGELRATLVIRYANLVAERIQAVVEEVPQIPKYVAVPRKIFTKKFISCKELYAALTRIEVNLLLVDTRQEEDYKRSRIPCDNSINIPNDLIVAGLSANTLGKLLPKHFQVVWARRDLFSALVLMDWNSTEDNFYSSSLDRLKTILVDWDFNRNYDQEPVVLNGGFKEFIDTYPAMVDNSHIFLVHKNDELDELLEIDDVQYPEQDSYGQTAEAAIFPPQLPGASGEAANLPTTTLPSPVAGPSGMELHPSETSISSFNSTYETIEDDVIDLTNDSSTEFKPSPTAQLDNEEYQMFVEQLLKEMEAQRLRELTKARSFKPSANAAMPTGIRTKPLVLRDTKPNLIASQDNKRAGFVGLRNLRNSCYMNTVLQCFRTIPIIKQLFLSGRYQLYQYRNPPGLLIETAYLFRVLWSDIMTSFSPIEFYNRVCDLEPVYERGNHEDCMEFFLFYLNCLSDDCLTELPRSNAETPKEQAWHNQLQGRTSIFIDWFYHQIRTQKVCDYCVVSSYNFETDSTVMLPVPEHDCHLDNLMAEYFEEFTINDYCCSKCKRPVRNMKKVVREPKILVIVLKRYYQNAKDLEKNHVRVGFKTENMRFGEASYNLTGIAMHQGNLKNGHYTAGCFIGGSWYECNDDTVSGMNIRSNRTKAAVCAFFYTAE